MKIQQSFHQENKGTLFLVGTPIGNLEDMTFRAVRILKEADWIAAEDTRQTRKLLSHFDISARLVSYHEHNKQASGPELIRRLAMGEKGALVSDAGLPAISDPGYDLVRLAVGEGIPVVPIPGPNAALSALIVSGLPTRQFMFAGFPPRDRKSLRRELERLALRPETILFYESPHRLVKTLTEMKAVWGGREIALVRELTKKFEEIARGTIPECLDWLEKHPPLGEYCIVVQGADPELEGKKEDAWWASLSVAEHVQHYMNEIAGISAKEAVKLAAADRGEPRRDVYNRFVAEKNPLD
jgi:16S rRNA (cytidine1402-2'-O)-methyltransferase